MNVLVLVLFVGIGVILTAVLSHWHSDERRRFSEFVGFVALFVATLTVILFIAIPFVADSWARAEHRAQLINQKYGTEYTTEDFIYASDLIPELNIEGIPGD